MKRKPIWLLSGLIAGAGLLLSLSNAINPAKAAGDPTDAMAPAVTEATYSLPVPGRIAVYRPAGLPRGVVIALSGREGWGDASAAMARHLADRGALVAGIDTPRFLRALNGAGRCINPNYALIDLSRDLQHRLNLPMYSKPVLAGRGEGAALAYAALAAGPNGAYAAALSQNFAPLLPGARAWCRSGSLKAAMTRSGRGWVFGPSRRLPSPWIVLAPSRHDRLRMFVARTNSGRLVVGGGDADAALLAQAAPFLAPPPVTDSGLPTGLPLNIVTDPAAPPTGTMAVLYSGDGGWVGLDKDVAGELARAGIPVVGVDSLSYFWSQRTPEGAAADLSAIIRGYSRHWRRPRILLVGYSFGADVLPYIVGRLAPPVRHQVERLSLLGLSPSADFQFHLGSWLNMNSTAQYPTIPAVERLRGLPMLCVRGAQENDSACSAIPEGIAQTVVVPGGHHFGRNAPLLAHQMLKGLII